MTRLILLQLLLVAALQVLLAESKRYTTRVIENPRRTLATFEVIPQEEGPNEGQGGEEPEKVVEEEVNGPAESVSETLPTFALVPKESGNPFFDVSGEGCVDTAERLGVNCLYIGPRGNYDPTGKGQVELLDELLANRTQLNLQGIAVSAVEAEILGPVIEKAITEYGIPVLTFDSDAPDSQRIAYVGTDNYFFGTQLAKVLKQVHPQPGKFAIVSAMAPNIVEREAGVRDHLLREGWEEVSTSPSDMNASSTLVVDNMFSFVQAHPDLTAIVPVMGAGMRAPDDYWGSFVKAHPEILLVVGDAMPNQLALLDRQQCDGLVGQLPYEMGVLSIETLYQLYTTDNMLATDSFIGTNVLEHLLIPLILPELKVDHNLVGELRYVGYCLFSLVAAMALVFSAWTFANRNARVVKVAQPTFLMLVAAGTVLMAASVLPLGFDDFSRNITESEGVGICMAPFWFLAFGFSLTFSSLFAKIYRVNLLFDAAKRFSKMEASIAAIIPPLLLLSVANGIILTTWTVVSPLKFVRLQHSGTDGWDRPVSDYGTCQGEHSSAFVVPLAIVNGVLLVFANWIAYKTRRIDEEFSESKYVGMAMASMLQAVLTGVPILFIVKTSPQAYYMVKVFMIFIICSAILLLIFVPKMVLFHQYKHQPAALQQAKIQQSIRRSTLTGPGQRLPHQRSSRFSDEESGNFGQERSSRSGFFGTDNSTRSFQEQAPGICKCQCRTCSCHCHLRNRVSTRVNFHEDPTSLCSPTTALSKTPSASEVLNDRSSWGGVNLSIVNNSIEEEIDDAEASDSFRVEQPMPKFEKPVDVLKDKTSWGGGDLSTVMRDASEISN